MRIHETSLPGVLVVEPPVFEDPRGFFFESYHEGKMAELGVTARFVQDNHSGSRRGTLRGLHYQVGAPQAKLCRAAVGEILDVAVDLRRGSPTLGRWVAVRLSAENRRQLFIPRGFAHGFRVLSQWAEVLYKCDAFYDREAERGLAWDDPDVAIDWQLDGPPLLSAKDTVNPRLAELTPEDLPAYEGA